MSPLVSVRSAPPAARSLFGAAHWLVVLCGGVSACEVQMDGLVSAEAEHIITPASSPAARTVDARVRDADAADGVLPTPDGDADASADAAPDPDGDDDAGEALIDAGAESEVGVGVGVGEGAGGPADLAATLSNRLLLFLRFDDPPGTLHPRDESGRDNAVTVRGLDPRIAWVKGHAGGALDLAAQGRDGHLQVERADCIDEISSGLGVAGWLRRTQRKDGGAILARRGSEMDRDLYRFDVKDARLHVRLHSGLELFSPQTVPLERWVHVVFSYDRQVARLYVDGDEVAAAPHDAPLLPGLAPLLIGARQTGDDLDRLRDFLPDRIDDLLVYSRALTASEVAALADGVTPRPAAPDAGGRAAGPP